ncbi:MAG TPA: prolipoprotein diacylglyceryl transferase family protein [Polyangiaceae bacterium]|jgi:phosphatidylglycerol:prolipoprotein diacylglycerol transferase
MHPILFRIPLPHMPLKLWWALAAVAAIAVVFAGLAFRRRDRSGAFTSLVVAAAAAGAGWKWQTTSYEAANVPIYAYGVMLGLSLVVGWYLTLPLAERDGLPKETMANCYVITALAALAGSRVLYAITNPDEFKSFWDLFALRNGGLVAYGGFIGGLLGSWGFLAPKKIRLLAWADDAVPSLASGLMVTRIGCYLFGCDFGKRLPDGAPHWLKTLGTFPHWVAGTLASGEGSPAYVRHLEVYRNTPFESELVKMNSSFAVHPTQLYESLVGLGLLVLLLWQRKYTRFRGQVFFLFVFAYGFARFLLELWRDDVERGSYGPTLDAHVYIPMCLLLFAIAFAFGISLGITNQRARMVARVLAFVPVVLAYLALKPASFGQTVPYQLSTSQAIGLLSAIAVAFFYARFWESARKHPRIAMSLGDPDAIRELKGEAAEPEAENEDEEDDEEEEETEEKPTRAKSGSGKKKGLVAKPKAVASDPPVGKGDPEPEPEAS